jgi:hypothetical protein
MSKFAVGSVSNVCNFRSSWRMSSTAASFSMLSCEKDYKPICDLKLLWLTCILFKTSDVVATAAFGPQMGNPSNTFSEMLRSVRKITIFASESRIGGWEGNVLVCVESEGPLDICLSFLSLSFDMFFRSRYDFVWIDGKRRAEERQGRRRC